MLGQEGSEAQRCCNQNFLGYEEEKLTIGIDYNIISLSNADE